MDIENVKKGVVDKGLQLIGNKIYKIILYGSYARGDFEEDSDVDIMMLLDCPRSELQTYLNQVNEISSDVGLENDVMVSLLLNDKDTFYGKMDLLPFFQNIQNDGVVFYG